MSEEQTYEQQAKEFFQAGRVMALPHGKDGVFVRPGRSNGKALAWVFDGTVKNPTSGTYTVMMTTLENLNRERYYKR